MISRIISIAALAIALYAAPAIAQAQGEDKSWRAFLDQLWIGAKAKEIKRSTFDLAFADVTPDPRVMPITKRQPEYIKPAGAYVNSIASANRASAGLRKEKEWSKTFDAIEKQYGVDRWLILSIWGMETSFGSMKDKWDVIRSLATLAHAKFRDPYFRNELIVALKILQDGHVARNAFVGSWAGAMGQTQFMPTNFMDYAVDFSGDGRKDIWNNVPDVLASTANYFIKEKWTPGMPWGFEVFVPKGFDYRQSRGTFAEWKERGVRRTDGGAFPANGDAILFFPTGSIGPAFLITENFNAIKRYNNSDVYALAIGLLSDRMHGGGVIRAKWPEQATQPSREDRIALQKKLASLGYKVRNFTGHMDFDLRDAIRLEQVKLGMLPDGHPSPEFLQKLGARAP
jgi:membrane-bound lytic murein transglycosylase B